MKVRPIQVASCEGSALRKLLPGVPLRPMRSAVFDRAALADGRWCG
jgi:hypothetical protein